MVLVSHRYKFIYLKTKKTGSTTVDAFFQKFCVPEEELETFTTSHSATQRITDAGIVGSRHGGGRPQDKWRNHKPAVVVKELLGEEMFDSYFKFSIIRNPWDKAVSLYHFHKMDARGSFVDFVRKGMLEKLSTPARGKHSIDWYIHTLDNVPVCNRYLRFENLRNDVEELCKDLGIQEYNMDELPHYKRSRPRPHYSEFYIENGTLADDVVQRVGEFYRREVDHFGYTFAPKNPATDMC